MGGPAGAFPFQHPADLGSALPPGVSKRWGRIQLRARSRKEGRKECRVKISPAVEEAPAGASSRPPGPGMRAP